MKNITGTDLKTSSADAFLRQHTAIAEEAKSYYWETKCEYYQILFDCQAKALSDPSFFDEIPYQVKNALVVFFCHCFISLREAYKVKAKYPLQITGLTDKFQKDLGKTLYPYKGWAICSLVDLNVQHNIEFYLKRCLKVDKEINLLKTRHGLSLSNNQIKQIIEKLGKHLIEYVKFLKGSENAYSLLLEIGKRYGCSKEKLENLKLQMFESLMIRIKIYFISDLKKTSIIEKTLIIKSYRDDLKIIRKFLANDQFASGLDAKRHKPEYLKEAGEILYETTRDFLFACKNGDLITVKELSKNVSYEILADAFYTACSAGQKKIVKFLFSKISSQKGWARQLLGRLYLEEKRIVPIATEVKGHDLVLEFLFSLNYLNPYLSYLLNETALSVPERITKALGKEPDFLLPVLVPASRLVASPEKPETAPQKIQNFFQSANIDAKLDEIKSLFVSLKPCVRNLRWRSVYCQLQEKFYDYVEKLNQIKEELTTTDTSRLKNIQKRYTRVIKKIEIIKSGLVDLEQKLNSVRINSPSGKPSRVGFFSSGSRSKSQGDDSKLSSVGVLEHRLEETKNDSLRLLSKSRTPSGFRVTGMQTHMRYKLLEAIELYIGFSDNGKEESKVCIFKAMQTDAILFKIMQFMMYQAAYLSEARLIRNAIVHFRGPQEMSKCLFDGSALEQKQGNDLHKKVMNFAKDLLSLDTARLARNEFYKELIEHGKLLRQSRETLDLSERKAFDSRFNIKMWSYQAYEAPFIKSMCRSALQMVNIFYHVYGTPNSPHVLRKEAISWRHLGLDTDFISSNWYDNFCYDMSSNSNSLSL